MPYSLELGPPSNPDLTLDASDLTSVDIAKPHTALADFDAEIPYSRTIDDHVLKACRIYHGSTLLFRGYLRELDWNQRRGRVRLNGPGIGDDLRDSAIERSWTYTATHEAIRQVWDNDTGFTATVRQPDTQTVVDDKTVVDASTDSELEAITDNVLATDPILVQNGDVELAQSSYWKEGSNWFGGGTLNRIAASDGKAEDFFDEVHDDTVSYSIDYAFPQGDWSLFIRLGIEMFDFDQELWKGAGLDISIDGTDIGGFGDGFGIGPNVKSTYMREAQDARFVTSGGSETDYTSDFNDSGADDVPYLRSSPSTGDAFYFAAGSSESTEATSAFNEVDPDLTTTGSGTWTITWEYYAKEYDSDDTLIAEGWRDIPNVSDGTNGFKQTGTITWDLTDIASDTPNGGDYTTMGGDAVGSGSVRVYVRARLSSFSSLSTQPKGGQGTLYGGVYEWFDVGSTGNALDAGSHDVTLSTPSDSRFFTLVDGVTLTDTRFSYTFDERVHARNGYLDGPQDYPDGYIYEFDQEDVDFNVVEITLSTAGWNDTTGDQQVAVSFDGGTTWFTADNATSITESQPTNVGKTVDYRVILDRYGSGRSQTPRTGYNGQKLGSVTVDYDGSDLSIIVDNTFRGSPLKILSDLHEKADYRFVIDHAATDANGNLVKEVESFETGSRTKAKDWSVVNRSPRKSYTGYANEVTVYGALASDGTRPKATVQDDSEVNSAGAEPYFEIRPDVTTVDQARQAALDILNSKVKEKDQKGDVEALPTTTLPGYSYPVDWFADGQPVETPLERVQFQESDSQLRASLKFVRPDDVTGTVIDQGRAIDQTREGI